MEIKRTKDSGYGWRTKFKYTSTAKTLEIIPEQLHGTLWKEKNFNGGVWLNREDVLELKRFIEKVYEEEN